MSFEAIPESTLIQLKRKTSSETETPLDTVELMEGEPLFDTNTNKLHIGKARTSSSDKTITYAPMKKEGVYEISDDNNLTIKSNKTIINSKDNGEETDFTNGITIINGHKSTIISAGQFKDVGDNETDFVPDLKDIVSKEETSYDTDNVELIARGDVKLATNALTSQGTYKATLLNSAGESMLPKRLRIAGEQIRYPKKVPTQEVAIGSPINLWLKIADSSSISSVNVRYPAQAILFIKLTDGPSSATISAKDPSNKNLGTITLEKDKWIPAFKWNLSNESITITASSSVNQIMYAFAKATDPTPSSGVAVDFNGVSQQKIEFNYPDLKMQKTVTKNGYIQAVSNIGNSVYFHFWTSQAEVPFYYTFSSSSPTANTPIYTANSLSNNLFLGLPFLTNFHRQTHNEVDVYIKPLTASVTLTVNETSSYEVKPGQWTKVASNPTESSLGIKYSETPESELQFQYLVVARVTSQSSPIQIPAKAQGTPFTLVKDTPATLNLNTSDGYIPEEYAHNLYLNSSDDYAPYIKSHRRRLSFINNTGLHHASTQLDPSLEDLTNVPQNELSYTQYTERDTLLGQSDDQYLLTINAPDNGVLLLNGQGHTQVTAGEYFTKFLTDDFKKDIKKKADSYYAIDNDITYGEYLFYKEFGRDFRGQYYNTDSILIAAESSIFLASNVQNYFNQENNTPSLKPNQQALRKATLLDGSGNTQLPGQLTTSSIKTGAITVEGAITAKGGICVDTIKPFTTTGTPQVSFEDCNLYVPDGRVTADSFNVTSDARLKENFESYNPSKSILDLPIYKFDYINGSKNQIGCKAQDLQEICPEIVDIDQKGYLSIQENKLAYLLIQEIKELKDQINQLNDKIHSLEMK